MPHEIWSEEEVNNIQVNIHTLYVDVKSTYCRLPSSGIYAGGSHEHLRWVLTSNAIYLVRSIR